MIREVVKIDEDKCNGCGLCVPNCHEGALQIIDGKARLLSDLLCDGLGACLGHCPEDAITIEKREAEPYNEAKVMEVMVGKGINTVAAHLKHLRDHNEQVFLKEAFAWLKLNEASLNFTVSQVKEAIHAAKAENTSGGCGGGCLGSQEMSFSSATDLTMAATSSANEQQSELRQWPVQMHLINPVAQQFKGSDLVVAADCVAFSLGNFHSQYLKGKSLAIACPKLDSNTDIYIQKLITLIDQAQVNTIQVMIMEVPCCGGLMRMVQQAVQQAQRKVPVKATLVGIKGEILKEEWI